MKVRLLLLFALFLGKVGLGQAPKAFRELVYPVDSFRQDVVKREQSLDLVRVWSVDSLLVKNKQRHKIPVLGAMGSAFGANWRMIDPQKRKYVGTSSRPLKVFKGIAGEVDLNIFLTPHLPTYVDLVLEAKELKDPNPRQLRHWRTDEPPYPCAEALMTSEGCLTVECECTPAESLREVLHKDFMPTDPGAHALEEHPHFGLPYPSMGLYGPWVFDCNHSCRPEIHPFDWIWWNDFSPEEGRFTAGSRSWYFAAMRDDTRRFDDWSPAPLSGAIAFPFYLGAGHNLLVADLKVIAHDDFRPEKMTQTEGLKPIQKNSQKLALPQLPGRDPLYVQFKADRDLPADAIGFHLLEVQQDAATGELWGWIEIRLSVEQTFAGKLTLWPKP